MASIIAIIAAATTYAFIQAGPDGVEGVALDGPLGHRCFWSDGVVETPESGDWDRCAPYDETEGRAGYLAKAKTCALSWVKPA